MGRKRERFLNPEPVTDEMEGSEIWEFRLGFDALMFIRIESDAGIRTDGFEPSIFLIRELPIKYLLVSPCKAQKYAMSLTHNPVNGK